MTGDDFVGEMTHGKTKNDKYCVGACDDGYNYDDFFWREKPEIKKFADRLNGKGQNDDTTNEDQKNSAQEIEWAGDSENEQKIDGEGNDKGGGEEFRASVIGGVGDDSKNQHSYCDGDASGDRVLEDVLEETILDARSVLL